MDSARWERLQLLFHEALERPAPERRDFLESAAAGDPGLIREVEEMLAEDAGGASVLDRDLSEVAEAVLAPGERAHHPRERFGPYRLVRFLGEGGMGVVWLGHREDLDQDAAVKILRHAWLSPARRERFAVEERLLARLDHPSIARLYHAGTLADGTPWFAMEYVEGLPITEHCRIRGLGLRERLRLFREVCAAVDHAHRNLVLHRDLKPPNVMVRADGTVKLLDFGISKSLEETAAPEATRTLLRALTPAYAAPEQIRGEPAAVTTDVYALGALLYELLAERPPFDSAGRTPTGTEKLVLAGPPPPPSAAASPDSPLAGAARRERADLDVLCLTAMQAEPGRRYRTAGALLREVDRYLAGEPLRARPDSFGYRAGKFVRRHRAPLLAGTAALAVTLGLAGFYAVRLGRARDAALAEAARTERIQAFMLNLLRGGDPAAGPADSLRVVTLVDRGMAEARTLDSDPRAQAELYETLGTIARDLGRWDRADTLLSRSVAERRALFGPGHPEVARTLTAMALLRAAEARYAEAESLAASALALDRRGLPPGHPEIARAAAVLGEVLEDRGDYPRAAALLTEAARRQGEAGASDADRTATLTELANVRFYQGELAASDSLNRYVLAVDRRLYGDEHPHVADDLLNLGALEAAAGKDADAERDERRALAILRAWYGDGHPESASAMTMLGRLLSSEKRYDEASGLLQEALAVQERAYGQVHPRVASVLSDLAWMELRSGRPDRAEADYRRMLDIYDRVYRGKHYLVGLTLSNLAAVFMDRKDFTGAEALYRKALNVYAATLPPGHRDAAITRLKLGRALLREKRYREAEVETRGGFETLSKTEDPGSSWLAAARTDLAAERRGLGEALPARTAGTGPATAGSAP